jgi:uncharacterized protein (TIRG00374 family)
VADPLNSRPGGGEAVLGGARRHLLLFVIFLSTLGYVAFSLWSGWRDVVEAVVRIGWWGTLVALTLSLANYLLRFLRWQMYLSSLGHRIAVLPSLRIYFAGFALTVTPGKAGEGIRSVFLRPHGVTWPQSLAAFFAERYSDLIAVVVLAGAGFWIYPAARPVLIALAAFMAGVSTLLLRPDWIARLRQVARRLLPASFGKGIEALAATAQNFAGFFRWRLFALGLVLALLAWGAEAVAFYYVTGLAGGKIGLPVAVFIYAFAMLVGAISFLPGGLGGAEVTMVGLLVLNGVPEAQAVAITVFVRLATLWFAVLLGLLALPRR